MSEQAQFSDIAAAFTDAVSADWADFGAELDNFVDDAWTALDPDGELGLSEDDVRARLIAAAG